MTYEEVVQKHVKEFIDYMKDLKKNGDYVEHFNLLSAKLTTDIWKDCQEFGYHFKDVFEDVLFFGFKFITINDYEPIDFGED